MREYIKTGNINTVIEILSEGNKEASDVLRAMLDNEKTDWEQLQLLLSIDDMNIRGNQIVLAVNDYCRGDLAAFCNLISTRDMNLVTWLNNSYTLAQAVPKGAYRFGKRQFPPHPNVVYIINTGWQVMVQIENSGYVVLVDSQNRERRLSIRYIDDNYFYVDGVIWHMCEFAEMLMEKGYKCNPTLEHPPMLKYGNIIYKVPRTKKEIKQHKKMLADYK